MRSITLPCFVFKLVDILKHIADSIAQNALLSAHVISLHLPSLANEFASRAKSFAVHTLDRSFQV